jgi:hypothetical protein
MPIMTNIRGPRYQKNLNKTPEWDTNKELHDCLDCKGCICEEVCKKYEEEEFGLKEGEKV